jgi:hypothetical protein
MPYDKPGPAKGTAFGIAAITQALEGLDFPCSKQDVLNKAGNQSIHYRKNQMVNLRQIIEDMDQDRFVAMSEIVSKVSDALHKEGMTGDQGKAA